MKPRTTVFSVAVIGLLSVSAFAAPIVFSTATNCAADTDVTTAGTFLAAYDWSTTQTVNSVVFTKSSVSNGAIAPYFTLAARSGL